jgi:4-hydroxybenzoyl-CoA thioesterase
MPDFVHRWQFTVDWGHCDPAGIVFNARFFEFFDASTWRLFEAAFAMPRAAIFPTLGISGTPLVDARARFIRPVAFGDVLEMAAQVTEFRRSSFVVDHRLSVAGEPVAEGSETRVWAIQDGPDATAIRTVPIPHDVKAKFGA